MKICSISVAYLLLQITSISTMKKCFVFLAEGFEETEAVGIIDVLRRGELPVKVVSITGKNEVCGAHGITVLADTLFEQTSYDDAAMLILPGGMPGTRNLNSHSGLKKLLKAFGESGKPVAAICAAPLVLGGLGLLNGKEAVCYPGYEDKLDGASVSKGKKTVVSGNIITSIGVVSVVEFGITIVRLLQGEAIANRVAAGLLVY
jgi:protein deglycase